MNDAVLVNLVKAERCLTYGLAGIRNSQRTTAADEGPRRSAFLVSAASFAASWRITSLIFRTPADAAKATAGVLHSYSDAYTAFFADFPKPLAQIFDDSHLGSVTAPYD
jgi:hypothetical protein